MKELIKPIKIECDYGQISVFTECSGTPPYCNKYCFGCDNDRSRPQPTNNSMVDGNDILF